MDTADEKRLELVLMLYRMSYTELMDFKSLAYNNISPAIDELIETAESIKSAER